MLLVGLHHRTLVNMQQKGSRSSSPNDARWACKWVGRPPNTTCPGDIEPVLFGTYREKVRRGISSAAAPLASAASLDTSTGPAVWMPHVQGYRALGERSSGGGRG